MHRLMNASPTLLACTVLGGQGCAAHDPPSDGSLLLDVDRFTPIPALAALQFDAERVAVFYDAPGPVANDDESCDFAGAYFPPDVQPSAVRIDLTGTGRLPIGGFLTKPGHVMELRLLVRHTAIEADGGIHRIRAIERCESRPPSCAKVDAGRHPSADRSGDEDGDEVSGENSACGEQDFDVLRFVALAGPPTSWCAPEKSPPLRRHFTLRFL